MRLDADHEPAVGRLEPFDQVARLAARPRAGDQAGRKVGGADALVVIGVDLNDPAAGIGRKQDPWPGAVPGATRSGWVLPDPCP